MSDDYWRVEFMHNRLSSEAEARQREKPPTANWSCKTCGWLGLELSIGEAPEYHRRWNSKQGKLCTGNLIKE